MAQARGGYIQQLPSGSFRVSVYAGTDPLTGRQIRLRKTCKTERAAQIELGKLLEQAAAGRQPETDATVAQLMDRYLEVADWDLSTRKANEVYVRRVIKPALGHLQVRKIRAPLLDLLYAQLRRCSTPGCTGKRFTEHRNVPLLAVEPGSRRPAWQQVVEAIGDDNIVVSTDYPHSDGLFPLAIEEFVRLEGVSDKTKAKILWDNCARLYKLSATG